MLSYMNKIALLKPLEGNSPIIQLIESVAKNGPKGYVLLGSGSSNVGGGGESGGIDYCQRILQKVQVIYEEKIARLNLRPANFVSVRGQPRLIDFWVINAIAKDTTNIQREYRIGTWNIGITFLLRLSSFQMGCSDSKLADRKTSDRSGSSSIKQPTIPAPVSVRSYP